MPDLPPSTARDRLVTSAFELFDAQGFDDTTVDDIANHAGVGRTTFFRHFGSKEAVIFPEHEKLLAGIQARLEASDPDTRDLAVAEAARLVLRYYVGEGEQARIRYRLISSVPALRAREIAGIRQYEKTFARALSAWMADSPDGALRAELLAASVVTAHNHVLRRWLRKETSTPEEDFARAMTIVLDHSSSAPDDTAVVVLRSDADVDAVTRAVSRALREL